MKLENSIGWCDATTNAVTGCDKVSEGCKNCYAAVGTRARVLRAQGKETWGVKGIREPVNFEPVFRRLNKLCVCDKCHEAHAFDWIPGTCAMNGPDIQPCNGTLRRIRLFADSNSDWLDPKWPVETLARFLDAIRLAPNVDVILLTKRIELWRERLMSVLNFQSATGELPQDEEFFIWIEDWLWKDGLEKPPSHVWLGVSVENQKYADERIPQLLRTPAAVRFLSVEPLLSSVLFADVHRNCEVCSVKIHPLVSGRCTCGNYYNGVSWCIVGAESGKNRRDCGVEAIESVVAQCVAAGVPVFCKQDAAFKSGQQGRISDAAWARKEFPL